MPDQMPYSQPETPAELSKPIETIKKNFQRSRQASMHSNVWQILDRDGDDNYEDLAKHYRNKSLKTSKGGSMDSIAQSE